MNTENKKIMSLPQMMKGLENLNLLQCSEGKIMSLPQMMKGFENLQCGKIMTDEELKSFELLLRMNYAKILGKSVSELFPNQN